MEMPEGWKTLDRITNEPTNRGSCTGWPKKDARKYLDLLKEMAEALEAYEAKKYYCMDGSTLSAPTEMSLALNKFKEWK